jgi:hypothetical protein
MGQDTTIRRTLTFTNHSPWLQVIITVMCLCQCHWLRISKPIHTFVYISLPQSSCCQNHNKVTGIKSTRLEPKAYQRSKSLIPVDVGNLWKLFTQQKLSNKQIHLCDLHLHSISHTMYEINRNHQSHYPVVEHDILGHRHSWNLLQGKENQEKLDRDSLVCPAFAFHLTHHGWNQQNVEMSSSTWTVLHFGGLSDRSTFWCA